jgi:hypothetical protein
MIKPFKAVLNSILRCHAIRIFIVGASRFFTVAWSGIRKLLEEGQRQKIVMTNGYIIPELLEICDPDQLPEKYGGTAKQPNHFWPPTMPQTGVYAPKQKSAESESK